MKACERHRKKQRQACRESRRKGGDRMDERDGYRETERLIETEGGTKRGMKIDRESEIER